MREMAHSICLIKLYQIKMRKNFRFFVSDYLNLKKCVFISKIVLPGPKLTPMSISAISRQRKCFHFVNFWTPRWEKNSSNPPDQSILLKFGQNMFYGWKLKVTKFGHHRIMRFLIGSCEFGHLGLWVPPGLIGLKWMGYLFTSSLLMRLLHLFNRFRTYLMYLSFIIWISLDALGKKLSLIEILGSTAEL